MHAKFFGLKLTMQPRDEHGYTWFVLTSETDNVQRWMDASQVKRMTDTWAALATLAESRSATEDVH